MVLRSQSLPPPSVEPPFQKRHSRVCRRVSLKELLGMPQQTDALLDSAELDEKDAIADLCFSRFVMISCAKHLVAYGKRSHKGLNSFSALSLLLKQFSKGCV